MSTAYLERTDVESDAVSPAPPVPLRRNRDFQILWSGRALSALGNEVTEIAYPLLMLALTGSAGYAGLLGTVQLATVLVVTLPAGLLADRINRRTLMVACDFARAAALGGLAIAIYTGHASIPLIFATAIASSFCGALFGPAATAALRQLVPTEQLASAQAQNEARNYAASLVGPSIGGWLFSVARSVPFLANAIGYVIAGFAMLLIRRPLQGERAATASGSPWREATAGIRFLMGKPMLRYLLFWAIGINLAFSGLFLVLVATWDDRGASEAAIGLLVALSTVGGLIGAGLSSWIIRTFRPSHLVLGLAWLLPGVLVVMGLLPGVIPLAVTLTGLLVVLPALNSIAWVYFMAGTPGALQGRVSAAVIFLTMLLQPVGPVVLGVIFDAGGATWAFTALGLICLVSAIPTLKREVRKLPRPEEIAMD